MKVYRCTVMDALTTFGPITLRQTEDMYTAREIHADRSDSAAASMAEWYILGAIGTTRMCVKDRGMFAVYVQVIRDGDPPHRSVLYECPWTYGLRQDKRPQRMGIKE